MPAPVAAAAAAPAVASWVGPAIGAGVGLLGGVIGNAFNVKEASKQREFAKNVHQYEVQDLKKAGLNPMLSANHGGAPVPSAVPQFQPDMFNSALQLAQAVAQVRNINADSKLKENQDFMFGATMDVQVDSAIKQLEMLKSQTATEGVRREEINEQIKNLKKIRNNLDLQGKHSALDLQRAKNEETFEKGFSGDDQDIGMWIRWMIRNLGRR